MIKIIWSPQAKRDYWQNIDYLLKQWTIKEVGRFTDAVDQNIFLIKENPEIFQTTGFRDVRGAVILPQITLFYRVKSKDTVELIRFWNNFQDPKKLGL